MREALEGGVRGVVFGEWGLEGKGEVEGEGREEEKGEEEEVKEGVEEKEEEEEKEGEGEQGVDSKIISNFFESFCFFRRKKERVSVALRRGVEVGEGGAESHG